MYHTPSYHYMSNQWQQLKSIPKNGNNYNAGFALDTPSTLRIRVSDFNGKPVLHFSKNSGRKAQYLNMKPSEFTDVFNVKDKIQAKIEDCAEFLRKLHPNRIDNNSQMEDEDNSYEVIPKSQTKQELGESSTARDKTSRKRTRGASVRGWKKSKAQRLEKESKCETDEDDDDQFAEEEDEEVEEKED